MDMVTDKNPLHEQADERLPAAAFLKYEERADGWSPGRQAAFLAHLADNGVVADAARAVGKNLSGGYALRRQARGYAFNLAWEAALIIARRVVADDLMTAAIRGEQSRWVREEGVTTYTRQNSKLALTLLDRINPATALPEVMAVATRFDWFLDLIERGASSEDLWTYFFDDALPHSIGPARARVRAALLLSEESEGFDEEDGDEDAPMEYKSMEGPVLTIAPLPLGVCPIGVEHDPVMFFGMPGAFQPPIPQTDTEAYDPGIDPGELAGVGEGLCPSENAHPLTQLHLGSKAAKVSHPSPIGRGKDSLLHKMSAFHQRRDHSGRNRQHAAIVEIPDGQTDPACLRQWAKAREDQQVGGDKGHGA